MKRFFLITLALCFLLLTACTASSIGVIGGADGPTSIIVGKKTNKGEGDFGKQLEKKPIRMFNVDGDLYYDSGLFSENSPRCGTMDGELEKTVGENEIPLRSGEANFETDGYQHATGITKEVNIDGKWVIFKKYNTYDALLDDLKYCYYIKGHLNNAAIDSEIIVLTEDKNVTFNDIYEPLLSSSHQLNSDKGKSIFNPVLNDKWGIYFYADDITSDELTLKIEQFGSSLSGKYQTGSWFQLEQNVNGEWKPLETNPLIDYAWDAVAYLINNNDVTELKVEWKWLYGELKPGYYRLTKEIMLIEEGKFDKDLYEVCFDVKLGD